MKNAFTLLLLLVAGTLLAQSEKPAYCEEGPATYGAVAALPGGSPPPLPKFSTTPTKEYKIQVAILRFTDPREYPFHPDLVARYRPCEQVWAVESRKSFADRNEAAAMQKKLQDLGHGGAYITDLVGYQ